MKNVYLVFSFAPCDKVYIKYANKRDLWDNICRICAYLDYNTNLQGCKFDIVHANTNIVLATYVIDNKEFFEL